MRSIHTLLFIALTIAGPAAAAPEAPVVAPSGMRTIQYGIGDKDFRNTLVVPKGLDSPAPAVLIVPDWMGPSPYFDSIAEDFAELGYIAMVVDVYGLDVRPQSQKEAAAAAGELRGDDRSQLRRRMNIALDELLKVEHVDSDRVAAVGYCFGGTAVLELARDGARIAAVVTLHGGLDNPNPKDVANIQAKLLILHGSEDPFDPWAELTEMQEDLDAAKIDYQMVIFGGAVHSFTDPQADMVGQAQYDPVAADRAWKYMRMFLREVFGEDALIK